LSLPVPAIAPAGIIYTPVRLPIPVLPNKPFTPTPKPGVMNFYQINHQYLFQVFQMQLHLLAAALPKSDLAKLLTAPVTPLTAFLTKTT
jgi:hypothetical protein